MGIMGNSPDASPAGSTGASAFTIAIRIGTIWEQGLGARLLPQVLEAAASANHVVATLESLTLRFASDENYFACGT